MNALLAACAIALLAQGVAQVGPGEGDVFAFVRAMDEAGARQVWPGFSPSEWPVAIFDGTQTILLRYPNPPPEFAPVAGRPGVYAMAGRHPAIVGNSTREIGGVRTGTVIATAGQVSESTMLAYIEEVFHVFWLRRHANFRPNEMARYAYPVKDTRHLRLMLAEDEALARALESGSLPQAAGWAAAVFQIRRERAPLLTADDRAFETGLEMMEGTANYVARVAIGQQPAATAARLRAARDADGIRWRFYDTGAAIGFLLDRFQPDWKLRIDTETDVTTAGLLAEAVARSNAQPSSFSAAELAGFESRAAALVAALSARQRSVRDDLLGRAGPRVVVEVASGAEPLRATRFDPVNLLVLDAGEMAHANFITLAGPAGVIEVRNGAFARGSFAGTVALTRGAGRHPLGDGIRTLTVVGLTAMPKVESRDGAVIIETEGLRLTLAGADARTEGETVRIRLPEAGLVSDGPAPARDSELRPCSGVGAEAVPADCGRLSVFENRSARTGRRIDIHFTVVRADRPGARQALFLFAGGPGQGSTVLLGVANGWARSIRATHDIVMVDQRGTGRSHPLDCGFNPEEDAAATFGHVFDPAAVSRCRAALERDADLTQYTTDLAIEDVEDVRAQLGYEQVSLYGGSYGTRMAQAYLRRYPGRVRAMVLDGVVPFDNATPVTYARSAQQALDRVFAACAAAPACRAAHRAPADDLAAILRRLAAAPAEATVTRRTGPPVAVRVSAGDFGYAVRGLLYNARTALQLPDLLGRAVSTGRLDEFAQRYFDREAGFVGRLTHGVHFSVLCAEDVAFPTDREIEDATSGTFLGRYLFDEYRNACARWPRAPIRSDARTPVSARVPTLLISGWFDPSTPPEFAERVARSLPDSRLLVAPSSAHGSVAGCARPAAVHVLLTASFTGMPEVCR